MKKSYLLGLLAKIKCSICSYQCENWYLLYGEAIFTSISSGNGSSGGLLSTPLELPRTCTISESGSPVHLKKKESFELIKSLNY